MESLSPAKNGVAAIRVSSVKQGTEGDSPDAQKEQLEQYAANRGLIIKKFFVFLESASKEQQPMQEAIDYCKDPKNNIQEFIIKSIDRFTRGGSYSYDYLKMQLDSCNVMLVDIYGVISSQKVNTLDHLNVEYKWSVYSPTKKAELLEAERAKDEIRDIMSRMIGAEIRYARMGYWVRRPLFGFNNVHVETQDGKRCILMPEAKEATWVRKMFTLRARGTMTDIQIVDELNKLGYKTRVRIIRDKDDHSRIIGGIGCDPLTLKVLWRTLENPVYAGVNSEKWTQDKPVRTKFPGLVSIELFNKANRGKIIISEKGGEVSIYKRKPAEYLVKKGIKNAEYPYKRFIMCPHCQKPLYGSASRGRLGKHYPAYHCTSRGHYFRIPKKEFDQTIKQFVESIQIVPEYIESLTSTVLTEWDKRQAELHQDDLSIDVRITQLQNQFRTAGDKIKFLSSEVAIKYMEAELVKVETEIAELTIQKQKAIADNPTNIDKVVAYVRYFLEHLDFLLLKQTNPIARAGYFDVLFDKLPTYQDLIFGTPELSPAIEINKLFMQKSTPAGLMVGDEGLEPPTL